MSYFTFICPGCKKHFKVSEKYLGRQAKCPSCQVPIQLPERTTTNESPPEDLGQGADTSASGPAERKTKACPFCGEEILITARKCKHCGEYLDPALRASMPVSSYSYTLEQILAIAKAQKGVIWCVLVNFICIVVHIIIVVPRPEQPPKMEACIVSLILLIIIPFQLHFVYKLASEMKVGVPILWALGMFVPCVSLILLLALSLMATNRLKDYGFRVGLMGAKISEIQDRIEKIDGL